MNAENIQVFQNKTRNSNGICRLCGRQDLKLININSEEGLKNELYNKIELHIPIKLIESTNTSFECCMECVKLIVSWHNFVLKVLETNQTVSNSTATTVSINDDSEKRLERFSDISNRSERVDSHHDSSVSEETEEYEETVNTSLEKNTERDDIKIFSGNATRNEIARERSASPDFKENLQSQRVRKLRRKKNEVENKYFCELCNKGFTRKFDMQRHKKLKHDEIDDVSNSEDRLRNKEIIDKCRVNENGKSIYECYICSQRTNHSYNLIRHMTIHTGVKPYVCHICGKNFRLDSSFRKHIKQFHEGVKNYSCEICDKNFGTKSARNEHLNTHSDQRPYSCDICQKSFKQKSSLYVHKLFHDQNFKFECAQCGKKFRRAQELLIHDRIHTGQKPYSCDICSAKFRRSQDLKKHRIVHSKKEMEWVCPICKSTFTQERFLKLHRKVHSERDEI
ncbi:zinc finger protein 141-like isoform X1 [Coccinella septempunctata]|uniref:zinc finger protein 141-like isoform X1 n=1 Tax=Coccinella septempunctata TaxID=41139 RepID=UPI001D080CDC|nr:zinc finger protein 141-like isoform X1 [Coccinella septempunctata]